MVVVYRNAEEEGVVGEGLQVLNALQAGVKLDRDELAQEKRDFGNEQVFDLPTQRLFQGKDVEHRFKSFRLHGDLGVVLILGYQDQVYSRLENGLFHFREVDHLLGLPHIHQELVGQERKVTNVHKHTLLLNNSYCKNSQGVIASLSC